MSNVIISVENLGKCYRINHQQSGVNEGLRHVLNRWVTAPFRALRTGSQKSEALSRPPSTSEDFWALRDVSLEINQGEVIGVIGRNGAGKSTLLKILSRITEPTEGRVRIKGRVASLLEVGTGFHPELTGRENVYLNGAILGMSRVEIKKKFDEIVAFAEVEKFLDTPVKRYSSGMYVRLAFAVAAHLEPEILIVDEVLAVGDAEFQKKCLGKMQEVTQRGKRTVIFVSHNISAVATLCVKSALLEKGKLLHFADTPSCIDLYSASMKRQDANDASVDSNGYGFLSAGVALVGEAERKNSSVLDASLSAEIIFDCRFPKSLSLNLGFTLFNQKNMGVMSASALDIGANLPAGNCRIRIPLPLSRLPNGEYRIEGALWDAGSFYAHSDQLASFSVINTLSHRAGVEHRGGTLLDQPWLIES